MVTKTSSIPSIKEFVVFSIMENEGYREMLHPRDKLCEVIALQ